MSTKNKHRSHALYDSREPSDVTTVKVRFAPSPTGLLHVGNVRIAILNYLFAKSHNGKFILRIDDTDKGRSTVESENLILEDLQWLEISWDEFHRQSERFKKYNQALEYLKSIGRIYPCFETKEELSLKRKIQATKGIPPVYDRASLKLSEQEKIELEEKGVAKYWRFKLDETAVVEWNDLVHGKISIPLNSVSDPIIIKSDGSYVYTMASVVDDVDMQITHIIRGDDHVTNTAVQIDMFRALSKNIPKFAHVPLLSSIDGQDVSKRTSSSLSMVNLRNEGIEPHAVINVLATLGTSLNVDYKSSFQDLVKNFSFEKMSLSSPKFNVESVRLLTKKIISEKSFAEMKSYLKKFRKLERSENSARIFWDTVRENIDTMRDIDFWYGVFFEDVPNKNLYLGENQIYLKQMSDTLDSSENFDDWIEQLKKVSGRKGRELFHPIRLVLTGMDNGPELKKIYNLLGREEVKSRIENQVLRETKNC